MDDNGKKYGYYKSLEDHEIKCNTDLEKITIDIRDITETRYENTDIAKVNNRSMRAMKLKTVTIIDSAIDTNQTKAVDMTVIS